MPYTIISEIDEINMIKDNYENRLSFNQLQKKYHVSAKRAVKIFAKYGLEVQKNIHTGKYSFNRDFFFQDSAELAYFLGWVSSDGYIQTNTNVIGIEVKQSDKKILEDLCNVMGYTRPILDIERKERGNGFFSKFILENKEIKELLINKYNIIPQKSSNKFCFNFQNLDKKFWKDYIRGYFDGDGSIKITGKSLTFQIDCTSIKMLLAIEEAFKRIDNNTHFSITMRQPESESEKLNSEIKHKNPLFRLYGYGEDAKRAFNIIYKDAELFLQRKYDRYIQYMK